MVGTKKLRLKIVDAPPKAEGISSSLFIRMVPFLLHDSIAHSVSIAHLEG